LRSRTALACVSDDGHAVLPRGNRSIFLLSDRFGSRSIEDRFVACQPISRCDAVVSNRPLCSANAVLMPFAATARSRRRGHWWQG
jgi:hypothetical protein